MMFSTVVLVLCLSYWSEGYPTKCLENTFYDATKQKFLPCSDCNEKNKDICHDCCTKLPQDVLYVSEPMTTAEPVPSVIYKEDKTNQQVVGVFFHAFIIVMVVSTLSVLICVGLKVAKERHREECVDDRHSHNQDVEIVQEVIAMPQSDNSIHGGLPKYPPTAVDQPDNLTTQAISKQIADSSNKALL